MRKVVNSKLAPENLGGLAERTSKKFLLLLMAFTMFMVGCNPKKVNAATTPSPTAQEIIQVVSNGGDVPELPTDTPVITENPIPEEIPFSSPYFVFNPTEDELKKLEKAANEYGKRLEGNYDGDAKFRRGEGEYFKLAKNLCGYFDNLDFNSCKSDEELEKAKNEVYEYICGYYETFYVIAVFSSTDLSDEKKQSMAFCDIETAKIFNSVENGNYPGSSTLKLLETNLYNIQKSVLAGNKANIEKYSRYLINILQLVFLENGGIYKENEITAFKDMYPLIQLIIKRISSISITLISSSLNTLKITMEDSSIYNMKELYEITTDDIDAQKTEPQIKEAIFALMDAYIYLVKSGQLTVGGTSESPQLIYTPSPKPE